MKINKIEVIISKVELKKNSKGEAYLTIDFLDKETGDGFNVISKDIELMSKIKAMCKYKVSLNLISSRYGLKLDIISIDEELGAI